MNIGSIFQLMISDSSVYEEHDFNIPSSYFEKGKREEIFLKSCSVAVKKMRRLEKRKKKSENKQKKRNSSSNILVKERTYEDYVVAVPETVEEELINYVKTVCEICYTRITRDIPTMVEHLVNRSTSQVSTTNTLFDNSNVPPKSWTQNFLKENSAIFDCLKVYDIDFCGVEFLLENFRKSFWSSLTSSTWQLREIFQKQNWKKVYFCGEIQLESHIKDSKISQHYQTIMFCAPCVGQPLKPLIVSRGFLNKDFEKSAYADDKYLQAASPDGMMNAEIYHAWLSNDFKCHNGNDPAIIIFNSALPYLSIPVLDFGQENNLFYFCIPPVLTNNLDILESYCFPSLQQKYTELIQKKYEGSRLRRIEEFSPLLLIAAMDLTEFASCIQQALEKSDWPKIFQSVEMKLKKRPSTTARTSPKREKLRYSDVGCHKTTNSGSKSVPSDTTELLQGVASDNVHSPAISKILGRIQGISEAISIVSAVLEKPASSGSPHQETYYSKIMTKLNEVMERNLEEYKRSYGSYS